LFINRQCRVGRNPLIDPVCGMEVDANDAGAAWEHEGTSYFFCSPGCMERFRADPERFLRMDPSDRRT
ncbi:MAG TPA: YHS domain-containing protein, partial [Actinomycetota bacterium]|nr:YHS domain-containing protein [Actinomycetota bacterium]